MRELQERVTSPSAKDVIVSVLRPYPRSIFASRVNPTGLLGAPSPGTVFFLLAYTSPAKLAVSPPAKASANTDRMSITLFQSNSFF